MPIRADNRKYYDARWRKFRLDMLEAAGNVCQPCGKPHRQAAPALRCRPSPTTRPTSIFWWCCARAATLRVTLRKRIAMTRRTWAQRRGQFWLSEEIRLAPFPVHTWPIQLRQLDLF